MARRAVTIARRARGAATLVGLVLLLGMAIWALTALGHGLLRPPPLAGGTAAIRAWAMARDAPTIFIAALRLVALVLGWYLAATLVLGVASRLTRIAGAVRMTDAISLPWVRSVVSASARLLLVAAPLAIPRTVPAGATNPPAATRPHEDVPLLRRLAQPTDDDPPLLRRLSDDPTPTTGPPSPATWTVRPGESFWSIASSTMTSALHHPPKVVELTPYWERLIAVNRAKLADPANPDLLYPGQVLDLPPTPTAQPP